jgi:hypothetical protein
MSEAVLAAIDIYGSDLRYAEVETFDDDSPKLLRLGSCEFDFDLVEDLLQSDAPQHGGEVVAALQEAFDGTEASNLRICVHPPDAFSFFTPLSATLPVQSRQDQILQHAALLTGTRDPDQLELLSHTVRTSQDSEGEPVMWVHVLATPGGIQEQFQQLSSSLPVTDFRWVVSTQAAARVAGQTDLTGITQAQALRPFTMSIGRYDTHTEYTLSRDRQWFHSHYTHEADTPTDRLYFAIGMLNRLGVSPGAVGRLFIYGLDVDPHAYAPFQTIFGVEPETLNPLSVLDANPSRYGAQFDVSAYAPCIGALL